MNSPEFQHYLHVAEDEVDVALRHTEMEHLLREVPSNLTDIEDSLRENVGPPELLTIRDEEQQKGWSLKFERYGRVIDRTCFYPPKYRDISAYKLVHQCFTNFEHLQKNQNNSGFMISTDIYSLQFSPDRTRISLLFESIVDSYDSEAMRIEWYPREDSSSALSRDDNQVITDCEKDVQQITNFRMKRFFQFLRYINETIQKMDS